MKTILSILLLVSMARCSPRAVKTHRVQLLYNDNVKDTILTRYRYPRHKVVYVHECSCDAVVTPIR